MKIFSQGSFLVPTPKKVILTVVLFYVFGWIIWPLIITSFITDWNPVGFPFAIHATGYCPPDFVCVAFRWIALIVDAMVWYLASAAVVHSRIGFWKFCLFFLGTVLGILLITVLLLLADIVILI